jgi:hypothetical protein
MMSFSRQVELAPQAHRAAELFGSMQVLLDRMLVGNNIG